MPTTPIYSFPYPALTDAPNGAAQIQALAEAVETEIDRIDGDIGALPDSVIAELGETMQSVQTTTGTTTSLSYTETLSGGTACSGTFDAPQSGIVLVVNTAHITNNSSVQTTLMSYVIRTGSSVGSGSTVFSASDDDALRHVGTDDVQMSHVRAITGLTPGDTYNIRQAFRTSGGSTGTYTRKRLTVVPVT